MKTLRYLYLLVYTFGLALLWSSVANAQLVRPRKPTEAAIKQEEKPYKPAPTRAEIEDMTEPLIRDVSVGSNVRNVTISFSAFPNTVPIVEIGSRKPIRRVADVETVYDPTNGIFNQLFASASARFTAFDDGLGLPTLKRASLQPFLVRNFFSDLKRHDLGPNFWERNYNGSVQKQFLTTPLWGVGSTSPYGHDGRSVNLKQVILRHGGEALAARNAFADLSSVDELSIIAFLNTLLVFPPDDTASNLNPGDRNTPDFPKQGHGSIRLTGLFNDPSDVETGGDAFGLVKGELRSARQRQ
jgi:hypothetical protein